MRRPIRMRCFYLAGILMSLIFFNGYAEISNQKHKIERLMKNGQFLMAVEVINSAFESEGLNFQDSAFLHNQLGLAYFSQDSTRVQGLEHLQKWEQKSGKNRVLSQYASDYLSLLYDNLQKDLKIKTANLSGDNSPIPSPRPVKTDQVSAQEQFSQSAKPKEPEPIPNPEPLNPWAAKQKPQKTTKEDESEQNQTVYWLAGGAAGVAAVLGIVFLLSEPPPEHEVIRLGSQNEEARN